MSRSTHIIVPIYHDLTWPMTQPGILNSEKLIRILLEFIWFCRCYFDYHMHEIVTNWLKWMYQHFSFFIVIYMLKQIIKIKLVQIWDWKNHILIIKYLDHIWHTYAHLYCQVGHMKRHRKSSCISLWNICIQDWDNNQLKIPLIYC